MAEDDALAAGDFSSWLTGMQAALAGTRDSDVPCGACTACCTSSQFVHIGPDETDTLGHIPPAVLFPAPGLPRGHVLLGYDERGHCPMLVDGRCSIYAHRPRTCRTYDCRIFPASGVDVDKPRPATGAVGGTGAKRRPRPAVPQGVAGQSSGQETVSQQSARWRFGDDSDAATASAVRAAAAFLDTHAPAPMSPTHRAVRAVELHHLFLDGAEPDPTPRSGCSDVRIRPSLQPNRRRG